MQVFVKSELQTKYSLKLRSNKVTKINKQLSNEIPSELRKEEESGRSSLYLYNTFQYTIISRERFESIYRMDTISTMYQIRAQ